MPSARDIRRRIKSVKNIQQITKAMKMVAAARLRRAQERAAASRPYVDKMRKILDAVAAHPSNLNHPLLLQRESKKILYVVVTADKGLAGAYTSNALREAVARMSSSGYDALIATGRKGRDYFRRRNYSLTNSYIGISERPKWEDAVRIAREIITGYTGGEFDQVYLVYTRFFSPMNHKATTKKLLPLEVEGVTFGSESDVGSGSVQDSGSEYIVEPSPTEVIDVLLPRYVESAVYEALLQSAASELGARMTAMGAATTNAEDIISQLTLNYNKVRQSAITREISEIVGGVEALQ